MITFTDGEHLIQLPSPEIEDSYDPKKTVKVYKTISGVPRSYVSGRFPAIKQLNVELNFKEIPGNVIRQLLEYINTYYNNKYITYTDYSGNSYKALITKDNISLSLNAYEFYTFGLTLTIWVRQRNEKTSYSGVPGWSWG